MCVPKIQNFEEKIIDFDKEIEKCKIVIRKFDEDLSLKADKVLLNGIQKSFDSKIDGIVNENVVSN